jgi:16S rRNA (uracil1498-N3)-methyltransferase
MARKPPYTRGLSFYFIFATMDLPIFFLETLSNAGIITLDENTSGHAVQVLRMKPVERLQLTDGAGNLLTGEIIDDHKKKCTVKIVERKQILQPQQKVSIAISLLKNSSRFEWFLEKATEVGVTEIIPILCERTEKQHFRTARMKQILISAMMQSKQVWLPLLHQPVLVSTAMSSSAYTYKLVAHCGEAEKSSIRDFRKKESVQILIGPEGDFTNEEIELAGNYNYVPVTLGNNRLRTETAGVVAGTLLCL